MSQYTEETQAERQTRYDEAIRIQPPMAITQRQRQRIGTPHLRAERHHQAGVHKGRSMGQLERDKRARRAVEVVAKYATTLLATVALFATVTGCAPRYIPVNHYIETERIKVERDSVHYTDTVRIAERGDTVLVEVIKWRTRYKTDMDTLVKVDTVQLPPQLIAQPERKRKPWEVYVVVALFTVSSLSALYLAIKS